jgi:hypothetical protein
MYKYRAFGLNVESDVPIELASPVDFKKPDVSIRFGSLADVREFHALDSQERRFLVDDGAAILHWSSVGTMAVRGGFEIVVDSPEDVDTGLLGIALSGPPLGILLHQRGELVLHASAVVIDDRIAAFVGHKGFGKSTTAAALHESGYTLFTDDILSVRLGGSPPEAFPGFSQLKLWPSAVEAIFSDGDDEAGRGEDKQTRRVASAYTGDPLPVGAIFVLGAGDLGVESIAGQAALLEILRNSYASRFVGTEGTPPDHFNRCVRLVKSVPVHRLTRMPGLSSLPEIIELVVTTVRGDGREAA